MALLAACSSTVSGHGTLAVAPAPASGSSGGPTSSGSVPTTIPSTGGHSSAAQQLRARLERPPAGATAWASSWAHLWNPTPAQFVAHVYPPASRDGATARLSAQGLQTVVHETWYARDSDQADLVLMQFATASGAQSRFLSATEAKALDTRNRSFAVPGQHDAIGYYDDDLDKLGNVAAIVYARKGNVVVEEFYFSPARLHKADAIAWMQAQLARLG